MVLDLEDLMSSPGLVCTWGNISFPARLNSSLWRRLGSSKVNMTMHQPHDNPKATCSCLACKDGEVRWVLQHLITHHTTIMRPEHTQMATTGTWQVIQLSPYSPQAMLSHRSSNPHLSTQNSSRYSSCFAL